MSIIIQRNKLTGVMEKVNIQTSEVTYFIEGIPECDYTECLANLRQFEQIDDDTVWKNYKAYERSLELCTACLQRKENWGDIDSDESICWEIMMEKEGELIQKFESLNRDAKDP